MKGLGPEDRTCQIDADLYVPAGVSARKPGPALLATNRFGGTKESAAAAVERVAGPNASTRSSR